MEIFIVTTTVLCAISLQMVISAPDNTATDKSRLLKLLEEKANLEKVVEVFELFSKNADMAAKKALSYANVVSDTDLKKLFVDILQDPKGTYDKIHPIIQDIDKKLEEGSLLYRVFVKPLWSIVQGLGYMTIRIFGGTVWTVGDLVQIFNTAAKQSISGYRTGELPPFSEKILAQLQSAAEQFKNYGNKISAYGQ